MWLHHFSKFIYMIFFLSNCYDIYGAQPRQNFKAILEFIERTFWSLSLSGEFIRIHTHNQNIAQLFCLFKIPLMPDVKKIIYSLRKHDAVTSFFEGFHARGKLRVVGNIAMLIPRRAAYDVLDDVRVLGRLHLPVDHSEHDVPEQVVLCTK